MKGWLHTTGIWQTVWLEAVHATRIGTVKYHPNVDQGEVTLEWEVEGDYREKTVDLRISFKDELIAADRIHLQSAYTKRAIDLFNRHITAPSDDDLKKDIELAKQMGFNGCRKHQKVEDPRFLYWADVLGFIVWGECAAAASFSESAVARLTREWIEIVDRDYNHPSIIAWVPINESWGIPMVQSCEQQQHHSLAMYHLLHSLDTTRLVISNDGWEQTTTDICAIHNYSHGGQEEPEKYEYYKQSLATKEQILQAQSAKRRIYANGFAHQGEPILLTEFGGIAYKLGGDEGWGYTSVSNERDFVQDYRRVIEAVYASRIIHGFCYTQLTDVEQEINGLLTYDRKPKCDLNEIRNIHEMWNQEIVEH